MKLSLLEKSVLATVAYYDVLEHPLTGFEIFQYLINPARIASFCPPSAEKNNLSEKITLASILTLLKNDILKLYIEEKNGFYCIKNFRPEKENRPKRIELLAKVRTERQKISSQMWKKSKNRIKWLQAVPFLKMVAVSGSLAMNNAKKESDIDLLIIAKHKRIWTVRFLITLFFQIIGERRHGNKTAGRFCLNHYITDKYLKINFSSLYNAQTYAHLFPILETEANIYKKFQAENSWVNDFVLFYGNQKLNNKIRIKPNFVLRTIAKITESVLSTFLGKILEKISEVFQKKHIEKNLLKDRRRGRILADDNQLEFHPASPETKIINSYNKIVSLFNLNITEKDSGLS